MSEGILFIVSGPSGGGKTSLVREALRRMDNLGFSVSCTTRRPRESEVDGKDYRFLSEEEFRKMAGEGGFAEFASVHGHMYGTPAKELDRMRETGSDLILDIDVQGARQIRDRYGSGVYCFVLPSSFEILKERLTERRSEGSKELQKRLSDARREMEEIGNYDYIIINDDFNEAFDTLKGVITSARCERNRVIGRLNNDYFA